MSLAEPDADPLAALPSAGSRRLARGEQLFRRGEPARFLFRVLRGRLRLLRVSDDGRPLTLLVAGAGDWLAEAALFAERYHCDAVADLAAEVAVYRKHEAAERLRASPELAWRFMALQAARLQRLRLRLELRNIRPARERVWQYLWLCADGERLALNRPLKDMASDIGLSHEAFYRALGELRRTGRIRHGASEIHLLR